MTKALLLSEDPAPRPGEIASFPLLLSWVGKRHRSAGPHSEGDVKVSQPHPLSQRGGAGHGLSCQPHGTGEC